MKKHLKENAVKTTKAVMKKQIGWPRKLSGFSFTPVAVALACSLLATVAQAKLHPEDRGNGNSAAENVDALNLSTTGSDNTAHGWSSLFSNTTGSSNTADGFQALYSNTIGEKNTANGTFALLNNTEGDSNTANGFQTLFTNNTGIFNTATGLEALFANTTGAANTAIGTYALHNNSNGSDNVALGYAAGFYATGNFNVYIGQGMQGVAGESNHTYIRNINSTTVGGGGTDFVTVDLATGLIGHASSSRRYKKDIKPMESSSQALFALKPVTFHYKKEVDPSQNLEYGLIAEDVAQVDSNLAIRDGKGQIESVRYSAVNAMLLNEFLKEHKKVEKLEATLEAVNVRLQEQAAQIQKVSAQVNAAKPLPHLVVNNP